MIKTTNPITGEVFEFDDSSPEAIKDSWLLLSETIKTLEKAKDKFKPLVSELINDRGVYDFGDYMFRQSVIQRQNYDKSVMRTVLDADTFDEFLVPDKTKIDTWLKENVENLGETGTILRKTMIPVGNPYTTIRLEKVKREEVLAK